MQELPSPVKGKNDWRDYRCLQLENGVTLALVHDPQSKTFAAAASVEVGAASDPRSLPGLAHFCEHMLFLGSEKYPIENEYKQYLAQHGGRSNASTSMHLTTYKFEIIAHKAEQALDIFSQFFVAPLFNPDGVSREVNAVDSENSKNLIADVRRRLQILKDLCKQDHYYSKFSTGNNQTLATDIPHVRAALEAFHRKHYRPDKLTVAVAGPQSLDELQAWAVPRFGDMKPRPFPAGSEMSDVEVLIEEASKDAPPYSFDKQPVAYKPVLDTTGFPQLLTVKPIRPTRRLVLLFPLPPIFNRPDRSPVSVISHLIGHEGPHSSFAVLQDMGLIQSLVSGPRTFAPDFTLFQIDLTLTERGEKRWREVVDVILQHGALIRKASEGDLQRIWTENVMLSKMFFDQQSPGGVYNFCPGFVQSIVSAGTEKSLAAGSMLDETSETLPYEDIKAFASLLTEENCLVERCSEDAWGEMASKEPDSTIERRTEKWYGVDFFISTIDESTVNAWSGKSKHALDALKLLKLPRPNRFIPRSLELCPDLPEEAKQGPRIEKTIDPPNLLVNDPVKGRLWHRLDDRYALPKAAVVTLIRNASTYHVKDDGVWRLDAKAHVMSSLLASVFHDALAQETYDADLSGLHWSLSLPISGIKLTCRGFSDRLPDLHKILFNHFVAGEFMKETFFDAAKDRLLRSLRSYFSSRRSDALAQYYREFFLNSSSISIEQSILALECTTFVCLQDYFQKLLDNEEMQLECFACGNLSAQQAKEVFEKTSSLLVDSSQFGNNELIDGVWIPGSGEYRLGEGKDVELHFTSHNLSEENGCAMVTYQSSVPSYRGPGLSSEESLSNTAALRLLSQIIREPAFDELRTKQTLGYIVSSYYDYTLSYRQPDQASKGPETSVVDMFVLYVLSRKLPPIEVAGRIDAFLSDFKETLKNIPESEIEEHASALSTKMLKPIQNLSAEVDSHFQRIGRYAPEAVHNVPWESTQVLANRIRDLRRDDLLSTWNKLTSPGTRSRVVTHIYGQTHSLEASLGEMSRGWKKKDTIVNDPQKLIQYRKHLEAFDQTPPTSRIRRVLLSPKFLVGLGVVGVCTTIGVSMMQRRAKR